MREDEERGCEEVWGEVSGECWGVKKCWGRCGKVMGEVWESVEEVWEVRWKVWGGVEAVGKH